MNKEYITKDYSSEVVAELMRDIKEAEKNAGELETKADEDSLALGKREYELGFGAGIRHALDKLGIDGSVHPVFGGVLVSRELAQLLLETDIPKDCELMCYEYGKCQGDDCPSGSDECRCWTSVYPDDLAGMLDEEAGKLSGEYRHFELVKITR